MKLCSYALLILLMFTAPAFAGVTISSPSNGDQVSSPFALSANATSCSSQTVSAMGYSLDSSSDTTQVKNTSFDTKVSSSAGTHTVHVKAWGDKGAVCVTDVAVTVTNVTDDVVADASVVPSSAISVSHVQTLHNWSAHHDSGANGTSNGTTSLVGTPSHSGSARKFVSNYKNGGAMRYSVGFGDNRTSQNFMYDAWVYVTSSASHIANLEMDVNQTMPNGQTVIFGVQCNSPSGTWDYTENLGSASHPKGHWAHSGAACNVHNWSKYTWHHIQVTYSRNSTGHVTYKSIWLDGHQSTLNHTVFAARSLGWGSSVSTNFQLDGLGSSGSSTVYLGGLTIYRW
jgi:hypothetical protein